jgi:hypothetical protein
MHPQQAPNPGYDQPVPPQPPQQTPKRTNWLLLGGIGAGLVVIVLVAAVAVVLMRPNRAAPPVAQSSSHLGNQASAQASVQAEELFYQSIQNASHQPVFHIGMIRSHYRDKAGADAGKEPAALWSSVSELDTTKADYRNVYAYRLPDAKTFFIGRCLTGRDLRDFTPNASRPATLPAAAVALNSLQEATQKLPNAACPLLGVNPSGTVELATARLNDGVFPVGFATEEAARWTSAVKAYKLFTVKDEGMVTKDGRRLRKVSFAPRDGVTDANRQLYRAFTQIAGSVTKQSAYSLITIGLNNAGGISGYYLVDESTKLPVYSELANTLSEAEFSSGSAAGAFNVVRTRQNYSYGRLTLDERTPLDFAA